MTFASDRELRRLVWATLSCARVLAPRKVGRAMAIRIPMMRMTTMSSMRVNPSSSCLRSMKRFSMLLTSFGSLRNASILDIGSCVADLRGFGADRLPALAVGHRGVGLAHISTARDEFGVEGPPAGRGDVLDQETGPRVGERSGPELGPRHRQHADVPGAG